MKRRLLQFLAIVSVTCALLTPAMWIRSSFRVDRYSNCTSDTGISCFTGRGGLVLWVACAPRGTLAFFKGNHMDGSPNPDLVSYPSDTHPKTPSDWVKAETTWLDGGQAHFRSVAGLAISLFSRPINSEYYMGSFACPGSRGAVHTMLMLAVPYWLLCVLFSIIPAAVLIRRRRHRGRVAVGHCAKCGYDLRATPDRCPECGTSALTAHHA